MRAYPHREAVAALLKAEEKTSVITRKLNINIKTVQRLAKQLKTKGHVKEKPKTGKPRTVNTRALRKIIKKRIYRNDEIILNKMAKELKVFWGSIQNIVKSELGLRSYRLRQGQFLSDPSKLNRLQKSKKLLQFFKAGRLGYVLWSDEKIFTVEVAHNPKTIVNWCPWHRRIRWNE